MEKLLTAARRESGCVLLATLAAATLAGCAAETTGPSATGPYSAEFQQAQQAASSDFEREALSDSRITAAEYKEAVDAYVLCLRDVGLSASAELQSGGMYQYAITYPSGTTEASAAEETCTEGTTRLIEPLYGSLLTNPNNDDFQELIVNCLVRERVVEPGYSKADLLEELESSPRFQEHTDIVAKCLDTPLK